MSDLKRRKLNTYYWTCIVIAVCMLIFSNLEWNTIIGILIVATTFPYYILDERGKSVFEDGESNE